MLDQLSPQPPDPLLLLIGQYREDPRLQKLDLGVGVYRNDSNTTPVIAAIKQAERILLETQASKSYLGPEGDSRFIDLLAPIPLGTALAASPRIIGVQTPGGGGALRLAAELIAAARPEAKVWVGTPTWQNHEPVLRAAGLRPVPHPYVDQARQVLLFDEMMDALSGATAGDAVLLHGCCHNPTGIDLSLVQWRALAGLVTKRRLLPFIDLAYQGLGDGLEADVAGVRLMLEAVEEALVAYSCDKNFGLYRDRTGALFVQARNAASATTIRSNLLALTRANWSMPPDHGAAAVRLVLDNQALREDWTAEVDRMSARLRRLRNALAPLHPLVAAVASQKGMFSLLPITPSEVTQLRTSHGIYMAGNGRANIAGLQLDNVAYLATALAELRSLRTDA